MGMEIEVKFYLSDPETVHSRVVALGLASEGRDFERNIRFEDDQLRFFKSGSILRLRQDRRGRLTFKSPPDAEAVSAESGCKVFNELEVEVSDVEETARILEALGYHQEQVYEKWRETFPHGDTRLCLDTMPFGAFLEIEGEAAEIRRWVDALALTWEERILENYLAIFERIRSRFQLPFTDITFDNFSGIDPIPHDFFRELEAGR